MKVEFFVSGDIKEVVDRIRDALEKEGFSFEEEDGSYSVHYSQGGYSKIQTRSKFWARKQLEDPYPKDYSIEIDGEVVLEQGHTIIRTDFVENHGNRPHRYGGTRAVERYVDGFCNIFCNEKALMNS
jgi:hypothetical protein